MSKNKLRPVKVPPHLSVDPFFLQILQMSKEELFSFNLEALKLFGYKDIKFYEAPEDGYIFARGTIPVCLCAHMDKVPWYKPIKKIKQSVCVNKKHEVVDVYLSSKQGIGGDDRCGVYAIHSMLKLGHRPSVLFCMGEEIGCRGSHKFTEDFPKDFLSDINAFIQIDRRGCNDCVRYSDDNHELTDALVEFGYKHAFGSCTDISVLMPHFGISGVNLSSGYYNEHRANKEFVSVKDVKTLLKRVNKILSADIFNKRYVYKAYVPRFSFPSGFSSSSVRNCEQLSLFKDYPYELPDDLVPCDYCGESFPIDEMIETDNPIVSMVCPDCAEEMIKCGYLKCDSCGKIYTSLKDKVKFCPFCGCVNDNNEW